MAVELSGSTTAWRVGIALVLLGMSQARLEAQNYRILHSFELPPSNPQSALISDAAGNLYGTALGGGPNGYGVIFRVSVLGEVTVLHSFDGSDGQAPAGSLLIDDFGFIYGTTRGGGASGQGTIFKLGPSGGLATLYHFDFNSIQPIGPGNTLARDPNGNLFGTTLGYNPGISHGTVFKLDSSGILSTLHTFSGSDGSFPEAGLIRDPLGNLYGTTMFGGEHGFGTVFRLDTAGQFVTLHNFSSGDGENPRALLARDLSGNLIGATNRGGPNNGGTVFRIDASGILTTLHAFDFGSVPTGLVLDGAGNLYGATSMRGVNDEGTVFRLTASQNYAHQKLYDFGRPAGAGPLGGLTFDSLGYLCGTTYVGGANDRGTVFRASPSGGSLEFVEFVSPNGASPGGPPTRDSDGALHGTTVKGGWKDRGTVYKLTANGVFSTVHSFAGADGQLPVGALALDASEKLYGTTVLGGALGYGTVFRLDASGSLTTLKSLDGFNGAYPNGSLLFRSGDLFGTAEQGGSGGGGVVFKLDAAGTLTLLHEFGLSGPRAPLGGLIADTAGALYGTTVYGGIDNNGTVFKLEPGEAAETLALFEGWPDGSNPVATLYRDESGALFGTTRTGGAGTAGTIFKIDGSGTRTTLWDFGSSGEGGYPGTGVIPDEDGILYGTTEGSIYSLDGSGTLSVLHQFTYAGGTGGALVRDASGTFYGTTSGGGPGTVGTVFSWAPVSEPFVIDATTPGSGSRFGKKLMHILGTGLRGRPTVTVGGARASHVALVDSHELVARAPSLDAGTLNTIEVTDPDGATRTLENAWFADFLDVDQADIFHSFVESVFRGGITAGCGGGLYCRNNHVTRAQMAVFLLKAKLGASYLPPACTGVFEDVACPGQFADWIEQLASEGITGGCGGENYCPNNPVTRAQMTVFLLKTEHGSGYAPSPCSGVFGDVACPGIFADWIEQLYADGVTGGCSAVPLLYCPGSSVTRGQMAVFLVRTFDLP